MRSERCPPSRELRETDHLGLAQKYREHKLALLKRHGIGKVLRRLTGPIPGYRGSLESLPHILIRQRSMMLKIGPLQREGFPRGVHHEIKKLEEISDEPNRRAVVVFASSKPSDFASSAASTASGLAPRIS